MKKIIITIMISSISLLSMADSEFRISIPQPDFVSNDWDGDTIPNSIDPDDDNDGIDDEIDSDPFSFNGQNTVALAKIESFSSDSISINLGASVAFDWVVENGTLIEIINGIDTVDVSGLNSYTITPVSSGVLTYTLSLNGGETTQGITVTVIENSITGNITAGDGTQFMGYMASNADQNHADPAFGSIQGSLAVNGVEPAYVIGYKDAVWGSVYISYNGMSGSVVCSFVESFDINGEILPCSNSTKRSYDQYWSAILSSPILVHMNANRNSGAPLVMKVNLK